MPYAATRPAPQMREIRHFESPRKLAHSPSAPASAGGSPGASPGWGGSLRLSRLRTHRGGRAPVLRSTSMPSAEEPILPRAASRKTPSPGKDRCASTP